MQTMKTKSLLLIGTAMVCVFSAPAVFAQGFDSGSDGSMGALLVTSNTTLALPPDGVFRFTTITVASGTALNFTPNALNTPVYLLATGDVAISGTIDVSGSAGSNVAGGRGGPGGFDGGLPGLAGTPAGDGKGPGAGKAGGIGFDDASAGAAS